jgi:hypothetical protein
MGKRKKQEPFTSSAAVAEYVNKGKTPLQGRKLSSYLLRPAYGAYEVVLEHYRAQYTLGHLTDDNVFTFAVSPSELKTIRNSLVMTFHKLTNFTIYRVGVGEYYVRNVATGDKKYRWQNNIKSNGQELYEGLKIDLKTGRIVNPREPMRARINQDKRKVWLEQLNKFKFSLKAKVKMGVVDTILGEVLSNGWRQNPNKARVLEAIKQGEATTDFIHEYIANLDPYHRLYRSSGKLSGKVVHKLILGTINGNSVEYRKAFGVFEDA